MATLVILGPPAVGVRYKVNEKGITLIGRDSNCDVILEEQAISRFHAQVVTTQGKFYLEDVKSTNGTYLNGHRLERRTQLHDGDRFLIHETPLAFFVDDILESEATERIDAPTPQPGEGLTVDEINVLTSAPGVHSLRGRLETLAAITRSLGSTLDVHALFPRILDLLFEMFPQAVVGEIHTLDENGELAATAMKHGREADSAEIDETPFDSRILRAVFDTGEPFLQSDVPEIEDSVLDDLLESKICAPIMGVKGEILGVILLETDDGTHVFNDDDLELVSVVGVMAGHSLGYSHAAQIALQIEKTQRQMETARSIQLNMLPHEKPVLAEYAIGDHYATADRVGGDFLFYERMKDGRVMLCIADCSAKGLSAAMSIARFSGEVRLAIATSATLAVAMGTLNRFVRSLGDEGMFITMCLCVLDPVRHVLSMGNAGHPAPFLKRLGEANVMELIVPRGGLPLGIDVDTEYFPANFEIQPGDQILFFTDGATEAMDKSRDLLGTRALKKMLQRASGDIESVVRTIVNGIESYRQDTYVRDDMTLLGISRKSTE